MSHVYMIGYEGAQLENLLRTLEKSGVRRLIDVRAVPISRKRGFSKHVLGKALAGRGIEYVHLKPLGTPKAGREAAKAGDATGLSRIYAAHLALPEAQEALQEAMKLAQESPTCLLCFEADPMLCHRSLLAEAMQTLAGFEIVALRP
jgi:uncharacterized protein (DUF488 family)